MSTVPVPNSSNPSPHARTLGARAAWLIILAALFAALALLLCGCNGETKPGAKPPTESNAPAPKPPQSVIDQLRTRPPVNLATDEELDAMEEEYAAIGEIAADKAADVDREKKNRWVKGWSKWAFISGFIGLGAGVAAFFLILWLMKSVKVAAAVGGALVGLGALAFTFAQIMAHWRVVVWVGGAALIVFAAVFVWYMVEDKLGELWDAVRVLGRGKTAEEFRHALAEAKVHNVDTLDKLLKKVEGGNAG